MIELYYWTTPNGHKITIFLEETGLPYSIKPVNIGKGDQFKPEFLAISPNNRIPAIVDNDPAGGGKPISVFESGAILQYLAEKTGKFFPVDLRGRTEVMQWLFWQMGGLGPMLGQNHHFRNYANEKLTYAIERYVKETERLYGVLDERLADREFVAGAYSIADMACYPWIVLHERQGQNLDDFPNLKRWFETIQRRDAVQRAYALAKTINPAPPGMTEKPRKFFSARVGERKPELLSATNPDHSGNSLPLAKTQSCVYLSFYRGFNSSLNRYEKSMNSIEHKGNEISMLKYPIRILFALAVVAVAPAEARSQDPIPFVPSPMLVVERMLQLAEVKQGDILYDLGSGDGRIVIEAAKRFGVRGVGVDLNSTLVEEAKRKAAEERVSHLVEFHAADGLSVDISEATVVTLYMFKWFNNQMRPKLQSLKPGSRVVAHDFDIDDWKPTRIEYVDPADDPSSELTEPRTLFLWKVEPDSPAP